MIARPMIHPLPPDQSYYRVTTIGRRWPDVLSGRGALYLSATGNRYNTVLQQAAYVCDDLMVAVTEFAYYAARDWQDRLGNHHVLPVAGPLRGDYVLWRFRLQRPTYVVDVEHAAGVPWLVPPYVLFNPRRHYAATQDLANHAIACPFPGHPNPQSGLRVPAVRSRQAAADPQVNYVLYRLPGSPLGRLEGRWRLRIEFLDLNGNPVGPGSPRIDWSRPRFQLLPSPGGGVAPPLPAGYVLATWYPAHVNPV
jgi:hypothetical protein